VVCIQTFAENLRWNPHVHVLLLSGMVNQAGEFLPLSHWDLPVLSEIFRREVFSMLQSKGLLTEERLQLLCSWRHSGFHVHIGAAATMAPIRIWRVTAELRCQLPNTSTTPSSRGSRAGSRAKLGAAARAHLINKIYGENPWSVRTAAGR